MSRSPWFACPTDRSGSACAHVVGHNGSVTRTTDANLLPAELTAAIERAGYHPAIVSDGPGRVGREPVVAHLVHQETTFGARGDPSHITVLGLTESRLLIVHADDHTRTIRMVRSTGHRQSESVPLRDVRGVMLTHVVPDPAELCAGILGSRAHAHPRVGAVKRVDLFPGGCADPG